MKKWKMLLIAVVVIFIVLPLLAYFSVSRLEIASVTASPASISSGEEVTFTAVVSNPSNEEKKFVTGYEFYEPSGEKGSYTIIRSPIVGEGNTVAPGGSTEIVRTHTVEGETGKWKYRFVILEIKDISASRVKYVGSEIYKDAYFTVE